MQYKAYDDALWRVERLQKATKLASKMLGLSLDQLHYLISQIEDAKGVLLVTWRHQHTSAQRDAFSTAWEMCKEDAGRVFFFMELDDFLLAGGDEQ